MNNNFEDRVNMGTEAHRLRLGSSFQNSSSNRETFHTIKYDFKPASVDVNKPEKLEVGPSMQVTVTVPHLDGAGTPSTVFKGPSRDYTRKDCLLIINRQTNEITLERLKSNIALKKTRNESKPLPKPPATAAPPLLENSTQRQSSKTKVSTGVRKNAPISFIPKHLSPNQDSMSTYGHKSPSSAPQWNANNPLQTLPSFPIIGDDYEPINTKPSANSLPTNLLQPSVSTNNSNSKNLIQNGFPEMIQPSVGTTISHSKNLNQNGVPEMTTSESSSDSNSSDSGSDSDSDDAPPQQSPPPPQLLLQQQQQQQLLPPHHNAKPNYSNGAAMLTEDLQLSDSNTSSDSDD